MTTKPDTIFAEDTGGGDFQIAPEGQWNAVCVDVIDLGEMYDTKYEKVSHKIALVFQLDVENDTTGERFEISQRFTLSMGEKARLRQFLSQWRGKSYSREEAKAKVPLHKLAGLPALVQIEHNAGSGDRTYANISAIMKAPAGTAIKPKDYERSDYWEKVKAGYAESLKESGKYGEAELPSWGGDDEDSSALPF